MLVSHNSANPYNFTGDKSGGLSQRPKPCVPRYTMQLLLHWTLITSWTLWAEKNLLLCILDFVFVFARISNKAMKRKYWNTWANISKMAINLGVISLQNIVEVINLKEIIIGRYYIVKKEIRLRTDSTW